MRKICALLLAACLLSPPLLAEERKINHSISLQEPAKPAHIEASLMNGSILVEGYDGKNVEISAVVKPLKLITAENTKAESSTTRPSKGLKKIANTAMYLELEKDGNEISIDSMNKNQNIALKIRVPFNSNLDLALHRGDAIEINNVHGSIEVGNHDGPITAKGIRGPIVAECLRHDLVVIFDQYDTSKPSSLNAHRGNIDVTLPKKSDVNIEIKTYQGEIYSGLDAEFKAVDTVDKDASEHEQRISFGGAMAAKLNKGTQQLLINTYRGDIFLRNK